MAYSVGDTMIIVRGGTALTEEWANTWCVNNPSAPVQDVVDLFHQFYDDLMTAAANRYSVRTTASQVRVRSLFTNSDIPATWSLLTGTGGDSDLPSECAIRVSIGAIPNRHGGPFLPAPNISVLTTDGLVDAGTRLALIALLQTLVDDLFAMDVTLRLNSPGDAVLHLATSVRVGQVFDAIRSRRADLAENYSAVTMP